MKLIFLQKTITSEIKNFPSIIDLIFMSNELINKIEHCKTKSKIKNKSIIRSYFSIHEVSIENCNNVDSISKTVKVNKRRKNQRNEKENLIN